MKTIAVIMAGGKGERFWPKSREKMPKQFISLTTDGMTMIQHTVKRVMRLIDPEDIFVVTNIIYSDLVKAQLPEIPEANIIYEPVSRNTAPCIGLVSMYIKKKYQDAVVIVLPADHSIRNDEIYIDTLRKSVKLAEQERHIVTIGTYHKKWDMIQR